MILLDSNIVIYSAQVGYEHLRPLVINPDNQVSAFTLLEVLGFPKLLPIDKVYFESIFTILEVKDISRPIIRQAINLRQMRKLSAGDALIAATALHFGFDLYTQNITDFNWIKGLTVVNPI
jgi:predicted nucleic acid-binding protein